LVEINGKKIETQEIFGYMTVNIQFPRQVLIIQEKADKILADLKTKNLQFPMF